MGKERNHLQEYYVRELEKLICRPLSNKDGIVESKIKKGENKLNIKFPRALRAYFLVGGNIYLNKEHNVFYEPDQIFMTDDMIIFMEENQRVAFWGIKISEIDSEDPEVYQGVNAKPREWYSEHMSLSQFIIKMWQWEKDMGISVRDKPKNREMNK